MTPRAEIQRLLVLQCVADVSHLLEPARQEWRRAHACRFGRFRRMRDRAECFYERLTRESRPSKAGEA